MRSCHRNWVRFSGSHEECGMGCPWQGSVGPPFKLHWCMGSNMKMESPAPEHGVIITASCSSNGYSTFMFSPMHQCKLTEGAPTVLQGYLAPTACCCTAGFQKKNPAKEGFQQTPRNPIPNSNLDLLFAGESWYSCLTASTLFCSQS